MHIPSRQQAVQGFPVNRFYTKAESDAKFALKGSGGGGITSINGDTTADQVLSTGSSGTDFNIDSSSTPGTSVFNIPDASATARGLITTAAQTIAGLKTLAPTGSAGAGGQDYGLKLTPVYSQTSTAAATDFLLDRTGTVGSGNQFFADWKDHGTSKFQVSSAGSISITGGLFTGLNGASDGRITFGSTGGGFMRIIAPTGGFSPSYDWTLPSAQGGSGKFLKNDGSGGLSWDTPSGGGGMNRSINSISADTTAGATAATDYIYLVTGTHTLTLPTAVGNTNLYTVKNVGTGTVTIATTSAQTIDGSSSASLAVQYTSLDLISDGSNWNVI